MDKDLQVADAALRLTEATIRLIETMRAKSGFDDSVRPVRQHASPALPHEIKQAFALMQGVAERIGKNYCDTDTETGRCGIRVTSAPIGGR
jgi:hypothetical protein